MAQHRYSPPSGPSMLVSDTCFHCSADGALSDDAEPGDLVTCDHCCGKSVVASRFSQDGTKLSVWLSPVDTST